MFVDAVALLLNLQLQGLDTLLRTLALTTQVFDLKMGFFQRFAVGQCAQFLLQSLAPLSEFVQQVLQPLGEVWTLDASLDHHVCAPRHYRLV